MDSRVRVYSRFIIITIMVSTLASCGSLKKQPTARTSGPNVAEAKIDRDLISKYEQIIGEPINMHTSLALYKAIDSWMNTPYKYGSMVCQGGTDCSGFVCGIYKEVYHTNLDRSSEDQFDKDVKIIPKASLQEGDLVFFKVGEDNGHKVSHVGLYLGNRKFVHASTQKGVCIDGLDDKYYEQHFKAAGRVRIDLGGKEKDQ